MIASGRLEYFDTHGRFWTPAWDYKWGQPKEIRAVILADGSRHEFPSFVCEREANEVYQASIRRGLGL